MVAFLNLFVYNQIKSLKQLMRFRSGSLETW